MPRCRFPECSFSAYESSVINGFCGYHQVFISRLNTMALDAFKEHFNTNSYIQVSDVLTKEMLSMIFKYRKNRNGNIEIIGINESVSVSEFAKMIGRTERSVYAWFQDGSVIKSTIIKGRRRILLKEALKWCLFFANSIKVKDAAKKLNTDYRYLRHLVHKRRIPIQIDPCCGQSENPTYLILKADFPKIKDVLNKAPRKKTLS